MFFFEVYVVHSYCYKKYTYSSKVEYPFFSLVTVVFGNKKCFGVVLNKTAPILNAKEILKWHNFIISGDFFNFIMHCSKYYFLSIGSVLELCFPSIAFQKSLPIVLEYENKNTSLLDLLNKIPLKEIKKLSLGGLFIKNKDTCFELDEDQQNAVEFIKKSSKPCLLEGVTGSGKTIVALKAIKNFKKKILILVPEINLSNNWVENIKKHLSIIPFIYHSQVSKAFKKSFFNWAISDEPGIIVGTRSALMIPYKNLDFIIVDEEHSASYRQDYYPYYGARDMAILLGTMCDIKVLLMSATPSLETVCNIYKQKYSHVKLLREPKHGLAKIEYIKGKSNQILSSELMNRVSQAFEKEQQVLFFLNRKGYVPYCTCNQCRTTLKCKNCETALTLYLDYKVLCHKCNQSFFLPKICSSCKMITTWSFWGLGVQKLDEFLKRTFPKKQFTVVTCDSEDISEQLKEIEENKVNGIISTQILAQGYDFKNIGLVVIVDADMGLSSVDFRSMERIYQLWQQLRGRSGRHEIQGSMILQYFKEDNKFLEVFQKKEIVKFLLEDRFKNRWPPFYKCAFIKFKDKNKEKLEQIVSNIPINHEEVFGPMFFELKNKVYEFRFLIRVQTYNRLKELIQWFLDSYKCEVEVDPI